MSTPQSSLTLESVSSSFESWRANRSHSREKIPEELWKKALSLEPHYPKAQIAKVLRINSSHLKKRKEQKVTRRQEEKPSVFVEVKREELPSQPLSPQVLFEIHRQDGSQLKMFSSSSSLVNPMEILHLFLEGNHASG